NGSVATVKPVPGITAERPGLVIFDEEISADGNTLYYTQGDFSANKGIPEHTRMLIAHRNGSSFVPDPKSGQIMKEIDGEGMLNYADDISASELEFFFTRIETLRKGPEILMASRPSTSEPFGHLEKIRTITGFSEAPSISPDGNSLYYHFRSESGTFVINRVTRP